MSSQPARLRVLCGEDVAAFRLSLGAVAVAVAVAAITAVVLLVVAGDLCVALR